MADNCGNHSRKHLSPEVYERVAALHGMPLEDTIRFVQATVSGEYRYLAHLLDQADVHPGIANLEVDCAAIRLPSTSGKALILSYTWDWLENKTLNERADALAQELIAAVEEGRLRKPNVA